MSDFQFANPNWSHALWLVAGVTAFLFWLDWRRTDVLSRFLSSTMQLRLVHRPSRTRRWLSLGCFGFAGVALVVALMRPQWGLTYRELPRVGAQIMVCLDVSKSMLAEDTAPNRLQRAKAEVTDLLSYLEGDQIGLIAFAGRAAVLCPLTPDFGFFRLILDGAGPTSVGRGGTRLEEPIRKALDSFRTESDISRMIVLITDGEDHDSHPLDAAKAAAERGVKILAIGFGDEAGSEIHVTDPQTGARTTVLDSDGKPVRTRLDGETLREMALATEGAYVPAGTGALDLKSIYEAHIAPLVRGHLDGRGQAVRREGFQWAVLAGLLLLIASIVVSSGSVRSELRTAPDARRFPKAGLLHALVPLLSILAADPTAAQQNPSGDEPAAVPADGAPKTTPAVKPPSERKTADDPSRPPRDAYNEALDHLTQDADRAERLLTEARREAGTDGEVRFRSTYNLGWVEVQRAAAALAEKPDEALQHLRRAADWFRDAVRLRPASEDARHNLEVVQRRILELADSLAKAGDGDLTQRLEAVIEAQRRLVAAARSVVQRVSAQEDPHAADQFRSDFRQLAVQQQKILADSQAVTRSAQEELDALKAKKDDEQTPPDKVRAAQLNNVLQYVNQANQRLGQARSQMRRRQADRSFRRAAVALSDLNRARDQLRGPVEVLDMILADALPLAQLTALKAAADSAAETPVAGPADTLREPPAWLTREYLQESQSSLTERTNELTARLQAGLDERKSRPAGPPTDEQQQQHAQTERLLTMVREAMPFLTAGQAAFEAAGETLASDPKPGLADPPGLVFEQAAQRQREGIVALRDARERFLDLRGLIELAYARQQQIQELLPAPIPPDAQDAKDDTEKPKAEPPPASHAANISAAQQLQQDNLDRSQRIARLIDEGLAALPKPAAAPDDAKTKPKPADPAKQQAAAERQQLELAQPLLDAARREMNAAADSLAKSSAAEAAPQSPAQSETEKPDPADKPPQPPAKETPAKETAAKEPAAKEPPAKEPPGREPPQPAAEKAAKEPRKTPLDESREHVSRALEQLQSLRRLFFSIIEHLRETAQRQAQLNDETEQAAALKKDDEIAKAAGPLALRQQQLRALAKEIAEALDGLAQQRPDQAAGQPPTDPQQLEQFQKAAQQLAEAAKLVADGGAAMQEAGKQLGAEKAAFGTARKSQDEALQKLVEALALLHPPQPEQQDQPDQQQENQGQEEQQPQQDEQTQGTDPARALQAVRDREAQRRRDRENRQRLTQDSVEKDW